MSADLACVRRYHEQTKHHPRRYARSLGYLDWANQPDPFRRFAGAPLVTLERPAIRAEPTYDALFGARSVESQPLDRRSISRLFYHSLALHFFACWRELPGIPRRCPGGRAFRWPYSCIS